MPERQALAIMAKEPKAGLTKTRLCPPLSAENAAALYACFLQDISATLRQVSQDNPAIQPFFGYAPLEATDYFRQLAPDFGRIPQTGKRLNERLQSVFDVCFSNRFQMVAAINSDSPTLPGEFLVEGFKRLESADVVLGPCEDGGYYFIGLKRPLPEIILPVRMSTNCVLEETLFLCKQLGLSVELLPEWYDVDTVEELARLKQELEGRESSTAAWFGRYDVG